MPSKPYSLRLGPTTIRRLSEEARRRGIAARTLAQDLVEEGLRMSRHPMIRFIDRASGRRAVVTHRPRLTVAGIVVTVRDSGGVAEAADYLSLPVADVERVMDYYAEFRAEVDAEIADWAEVAEREERLWRERQGLLARSP